MAVDKIILELQADVKGFKAELGNVRKELDTTQKKVADTGKAATNEFNQVGNSLKGLAGTIGLAFGVQQVIQFGKASVNAYAEAELNAKKLTFAVKNIANENQAAADKLLAQSSQLQAVSIFSDDDIQMAQTAFLQYGLTTEQVERMIPAIVDLASATGETLASAQERVLSGINGQTKGLKDVGLQFKDTGDKTKNFEKILDGLNTKFKGATEDSLNTTSGSLKNLQNKFGEVQEQIGAALIPALDSIISTLSEAATNTDFNDIMVELGEILTTITQPIGNVLSAFNGLFEAISGTTSTGDKLVGTLDILGGVLDILIIPIKLISDLIVGLTNAITNSIKWFQEIRKEGGLLSEVFDKLAAPFEWIGEQIDKLRDGQEKLATKTNQTTTAVTEQTKAIKADTEETKKNTETKQKQLSAFELLNKQLDTARKLLMEQIITGKNYTTTQQTVIDLTNRLKKAQDEYNLALQGVNLTSNEQLVLEEKKPVLIKNTSDAVKKYGEEIAKTFKKIELPDPGEDPVVKRMNAIIKTSQGIGSVAGALSDLFVSINEIAAQEGQKSAAFQKSLTIFAIQLKLAESIANVIANITKNSTDPLTIAANIISGIAAITTAIAQTSAIVNKAQVPQYAEGTAFVGLNGNPKGIDTIPAYLNEGEAVIPTDMNNKYPGLASSWIKGNLDEYIMSNWVAPAIEQQRNKDLANNIAEALKINGMFDDYRLYRSLEKNSSINQSGFHSLAKAINKNNKKRGGYA